ncbi:RNA polymerase [Niastella yeongjuensis]|uniref:RNA polymerase sigma factor n=1 Tax=Niastella yeongjuensis TaxID=354355 RepID=A0A1V9ENG6_9BACT|nr:sigma-70 family RNA polymerase sigma factor [Niastella yeongjuensis]OQP47494.1 RNA polymerase [Niastella yeongjuensis]SEN86728.1 RNA polymerase sigma-70 factor, ECF subfamily [Niastella yeongjuensis]
MDELYIQKVLNGDVQAFRYFLTTYKDMAYTIAVSVVKDEFVAQEVVQDAFLKAFGNLQHFNKRSTFRTWFYRIVVNEALKRLKRQRKEKILYGQEDNDAAVDNSMLLNMQKEEQVKMINMALDKLAPRESLVLRLFYLEEQNIKSLSKLMGLSVANIKVLLFRARKSMLQVCGELLKRSKM